MTNNKTGNKGKELVNADIRQPAPQIDRAATHTAQGEFNTGAAELQQKMKIAAKKIVELDDWLQDQEPAPNEDHYAMCTRVLTPLIHCIPNGQSATVFFRLDKTWIKLTKENVADAFRNLFSSSDEAEASAKYILKGLRAICKEQGRVSWVLPKLGTEVVE